MNRRAILLGCQFLALLLLLGGKPAAEFTLEGDDVTLTESATLAKEVYRIEDANDDGVLHIRGDGITVDFQGATLDGSLPDAMPDEFHGRGIVIEDSNGVVLRNLTLRGFKLALYARNCQNLTIEGCDFSDNWKQRLLSTPQAENGADWLFGHENDANEWFRYGAAIYLEGCTEFTVRNCVGHRGQNGLCLIRSNDGAVYDNDFSFNSGWGLAMYRACRNRFRDDKVDIRLGNTSEVTIAENDLAGAPTALEVNGRSRGVKLEGNNIEGESRAAAEAEVKFGRNYFKGKRPAGANAAEAPFKIDFAKRDVSIDGRLVIDNWTRKRMKPT